ncbi:MAG: hypothetical protein IT426_02620 [Pirellulales bacterium]|nr:hypothetical protein [Pirellulales bacterium]
MLFIFFIAILNLALGFALAMFLGGHFHTVRKFGVNIPLPFKSASTVEGKTTAD